MDNIADVTMTGEVSGDYFGNSVSTAGDVNGDGYSDVIVSAYFIAGGSARIYFGGTSMDNTADVIMTGEAGGDWFGYSVSTAGDVNGDGYSDVIVGAPLNDTGEINAGSAYIYFGGASMDNSADVTMTGETAGDYFGVSVSTADDVNGDGYSDVIVGAYGNDAGGNAAGRAYLYLSSSPPVVLSANVKIYLEGPYLTGNMSIELNTFGFIPLDQPFNITPWNYSGTETVGSIPTGVVDWILVELRSDLTTLVSRRAGFLKSDGSIIDLNGVSSLLHFAGVSNGDYYVIVYQRNHIPIMTANPIALSETSTLYDFTTAQIQAYGTNAMVDLGGGACGMCSGDVSKDGQIDADDRAATWNERNEVGYKDEDVSMDGQVDADDRATTWNNRNIVSQVPAAVTAMSQKNNNQNNVNK